MKEKKKRRGFGRGREKKRKCLRCDILFMSEGAHHRHCKGCHKVVNDRMDAFPTSYIEKSKTEKQPTRDIDKWKIL